MEIGNIDMDHYRKSVALVSQEPKLFNLTIEENIAYGLHDDPPTRVCHVICSYSAVINNMLLAQ